MRIVLASRNKHKIKEMEAFLAPIIPDIHILSLDDIGFTGDIDENGETFEENAVIKAGTPAKLGYIGVADDSGLAVDALNGAPGVYSARYAGEHGGDFENNELLLRNLSIVADTDRGARFVSVIACVFPNGDRIVARGECPGVVLHEYRGDGGFGYDPLFLYEPMGKTFAEMNAEEKNSISHRANAMRIFAKKFAEYYESHQSTMGDMTV